MRCREPGFAPSPACGLPDLLAESGSSHGTDEVARALLACVRRVARARGCARMGGGRQIFSGWARGNALPAAGKAPQAVRPMIFGAHESVAGGLHRAIALAGEDRCEAVQIFTKVSGQWREPALSAEQVAAFRAARAAWPRAGRTLAHASYLINLCADDAAILERSREALFQELARCDALGIDFVVFHPGAPRSLGEEAGLDRIGESLSIVLSRAKGLRAQLCIENTAGQGSTLGDRVDQIAAMIERAGPEGSRLGVCIDTQHAFAAGHDLRSEAGYERFWARLRPAARAGSAEVHAHERLEARRSASGSIGTSASATGRWGPRRSGASRTTRGSRRAGGDRAAAALEGAARLHGGDRAAARPRGRGGAGHPAR